MQRAAGTADWRRPARPQSRLRSRSKPIRTPCESAGPQKADKNDDSRLFHVLVAESLRRNAKHCRLPGPLLDSAA